MFRGHYRNLIFILKVGGRNFERPNLERPIFRNLKIANVESYERSNYSIVLVTKLFISFFLKLFEHSNFGFFQF